jgi:hypothetical protein
MNLQLQLGIDRHAELDARILAILKSGEATWRTQELARLLAGHKGAANAVSIAEIRRQLSFFISPRDVKDSVKDLIERFGVPIGGSRRPPFGYFLIVTAEDQADAARPLRNELKSLSRRLRALSSKHELARLFGQVQLELDREDPPTNADKRGSKPEAA